MTLIFSVHPDKSYPVLISDVVVSIAPEELNDKNINIAFPTTGNIETPQAHWDRIPVRIYSKTSAISSTLFVSWSGSVAYAKSTLRKIYAAEQKTKFTRKNLMKFLNKECPPNLSLIGLIVENNVCHAFSFNGKGYGSRAAPKAFMEGSGTPELVNILNKKIITNAETQISKIHKPGGEVIETYLIGLAASGMLIEEDVRSGRSVGKGYGGYYEISLLGNAGLIKGDDHSYAFFEAHIDHLNRVTFKPLAYIKPKYLGDILAVRRINFDWSSGEMRILSDETIAFAPIHRTIKKSELTDLKFPKLSAKATINFVYVPNVSDPGTVGVVSQITIGDNWICFDEVKNPADPSKDCLVLAVDREPTKASEEIIQKVLEMHKLAGQQAATS